jgi:hypothetical protein
MNLTQISSGSEKRMNMNSYSHLLDKQRKLPHRKVRVSQPLGQQAKATHYYHKVQEDGVYLLLSQVSEYLLAVSAPGFWQIEQRFEQNAQK